MKLQELKLSKKNVKKLLDLDTVKKVKNFKIMNRIKNCN
jgi:hypothetical protein